MKLSPRLNAVAYMIPPCETVADIGTDHAYIPIFCVENGIAQRAIACDVNEGPLQIARENIRNNAHRIQTRLSNGLAALAPNEAQCIVIAGMGGALIIDILRQGEAVIGDQTELILQPMLAVDEVRRYLFENGFFIKDEALACEERKIYNIISARKGKCNYDEFNIFVGEKLVEHGGELFAEHMRRKIKTVTKILDGIAKSKTKNDEFYKYINEMNHYKEALKRVENHD